MASAWNMSVAQPKRYNRALSYFDPNLELPISAAAQAAYARNPIPELPASQFKVRGGSVYAGRNGVPRELWQSELMWLPAFRPLGRFGPKTVVRGGYGTYYDTLNVMNQSADQYGFSRVPTRISRTTAGTNWLAGNPRNGISPIVDPFPVRANGTRFDAPLHDALGSMARVGQDFTFGRYDREHPRVQTMEDRCPAGTRPATCWSKRPIGVSMAIAYSRQSELRLDALPSQYWNTSNDAE